MKTYYHATELSNLNSIVCSGLELRNMEKLVYLCEKPEDCLKFALVHGVRGEVLVLTVELDEADVIETFDHSEAFFKCRCWVLLRQSRRLKSSSIRNTRLETGNDYEARAVLLYC